ncbi:MAG: hypothetical protein R3210_09395 [Roseovarius sp.]|nr:hypothetical protein [Roseovarius sp.]
MSPTDEYETLRIDMRKLRPGLMLDPLTEAPRPELTDAEIHEAIAEALQEQDPQAVAAARDAVTQAVARGGPPPSMPQSDRSGAAAARSHAAFEPISAADDTETGGRQERRALREGWLGRVMIALSAVVVFYTWPWIVPTLIIGAIWLSLIAFIFIGAERIAACALWFYRWLDARAPSRAERLRATADSLAVRLDALFDRLPGRWSEGLYMPDFSREALIDEVDEDAPDPFDRLAAQAHHG